MHEYVILFLVLVTLVLTVVILIKKDNKDREKYCVRISPFDDEYCNCMTGCMTKS